MHKIEKPSPTEPPLLFELDPKPAEEMLASRGGIPLVVQAFRSSGLPGSVKQHVAVKERQRGYDEATFVESFVMLNAAGGECLDDFLRWSCIRCCPDRLSPGREDGVPSQFRSRSPKCRNHSLPDAPPALRDGRKHAHRLAASDSRLKSSSRLWNQTFPVNL
jgi:hypothetical protein